MSSLKQSMIRQLTTLRWHYWRSSSLCWPADRCIYYELLQVCERRQQPCPGSSRQSRSSTTTALQQPERPCCAPLLLLEVWIAIINVGISNLHYQGTYRKPVSLLVEVEQNAATTDCPHGWNYQLRQFTFYNFHCLTTNSWAAEPLTYLQLQCRRLHCWRGIRLACTAIRSSGTDLLHTL